MAKDFSDHPNPYVRYGVGSAADMRAWEEGNARAKNPQWQMAEASAAVARNTAPIPTLLVAIVGVLLAILWRVW